MIETADIRVETSGARRLFALGVLYALGALMLWLAFAGPATSVWSVVLVVIGGGVLALGEGLRRATALALELTEEGLRDSSGRWIARWEEIERVETGTFAFRPSNGFALRLRRPGPRAWAPGLWWRVGRRVGIGGVTPKQPTRALGEAMALRLAA